LTPFSLPLLSVHLSGSPVSRETPVCSGPRQSVHPRTCAEAADAASASNASAPAPLENRRVIIRMFISLQALNAFKTPLFTFLHRYDYR
jgi:hypothetical protein